ncbi:uncharacterized protein LOC132559494 [Ylistrum balloti]|uniref:uncharacterized protein LOC132559494 n=1 Tax=Ylistrum balloti TaxID=509963 RepID=UPI00290592FE|nr:uncharacterized protein LOC132559494 [Ylistrum balloti]
MASFIKDPHFFTKTLLGGVRSGRLESSTADIEQHLKETHGDEEREIPLGECPRIEVEEPTEFPLDIKEPTWKEIQDVVKKARTGSPPGPSGIPYMGMNLIIKAAGRETRGPRTESGIYQPSNRGCMDDLTVTTTTHVQARWVLSVLEEVVSWARMTFKARKSRCMILKKGHLTRQFKLKVQRQEIPSIVDNPIKCLGKWFDASQKDTNSSNNMQKQATEWMRKIDKSVEGIERSISSYLRRWFGVPSSFSNIGLYSRTSALQLPLSSVVEEFKVTKARLVKTLRDSKDAKIRQAGTQTRTGRKWSASQSVEQAEGALKHRDMIGATCSGRQGLGATHFQGWEGTDDKEKRSTIQGEIRREEERARKARAVEMGSQGAWTRWKLPERKLTWTDLWRYEPLRIQFLLRSVYDTLPSPANLHQWGLVEEPKCQLCQERGTMSRILSACKTALTQGRYQWRHDQVLREMAEVLEVERKRKSPPRKHKPSFIRFVKAGD